MGALVTADRAGIWRRDVCATKSATIGIVNLDFKGASVNRLLRW